MKNTITKLLLSVSSIILLAGCGTYHITTSSLLEQFADSQKEKKVNYIIAFPFIFPGRVTGNDLRSILVLDAQNKEYTLKVSRKTGVRIYTRDGKKSTFYFDTLLIQDSVITGKKDHFFGINAKPINLSKIDKIELLK